LYSCVWSKSGWEASRPWQKNMAHGLKIILTAFFCHAYPLTPQITITTIMTKYQLDKTQYCLIVAPSCHHR
jgi:hypothetical protein